jgi:hypothetical protein
MMMMTMARNPSLSAHARVVSVVPPLPPPPLLLLLVEPRTRLGLWRRTMDVAAVVVEARKKKTAELLRWRHRAKSKATRVSG